MKRVRLVDIVAAIGADSSEGVWYVDTESGATEVVTESVMDAVLTKLELPQEIPADVRLMYQLAHAIVFDESERFLKLPGQLDVLEWDIMRRFAQSRGQEPMGLELAESIRGTNAFRAFSICVRKHRLNDAWQEYRELALREVAVQFCEQHEIPFDE